MKQNEGGLFLDRVFGIFFPERFGGSAESWLIENDYQTYGLGKMFRTLASQIQWTQGSSNADSGWMNIGNGAYEVLRDEKCAGSLVGLPKKLTSGRKAGVDEWEKILTETGHPDTLRLLIPNVATVAKIVSSLSFELGLSRLENSSIARVLAPTIDLGGVKSINYPVDRLIPTSSTDGEGNVLAFKLHKSNGIRSSIVSFESVPKSTKFDVVMPVAIPNPSL